MTNYDLYDLVDYIAFLRNFPKRPSNLFYLNCAINALGSEGKSTGNINEIMMLGETCYIKSEDRTYLPFSKKEIVEDDHVYYVYRAIFAELKRLYLLGEPKAYKAFELLADSVHNLGYDILENDLKLPFRKLKRCLKCYWRKYNKLFLRNFVCNGENSPTP